MKRPRVRKWAKWACTVAAVVAVTVASLSAFLSCTRVVSRSKPRLFRSIALKGGLLWVSESDGWGWEVPTTDSGWIVRCVRGWNWGLAGEPLPMGTPGPWRAGVARYKTSDEWHAGVSLMYPVILTVIPVGLLWWADRRCVRPGRCSGCGYDRRGLAAGAKCPECGTVRTRG
jgi:hypothetical protein